VAEMMKRELLWLIGGVLMVDAVFIATYFLTGLQTTNDTAKVAFTAVWTLVTLMVVLRGLTRIRRLRLQSRDKSA
jgi:nitric oxide reductase large subunit